MTEKIYWGVAALVCVGIIYLGAKVYQPVLTAFHVLISFLLMIVILLQSGKAADLAGAFGGAGSQTAFGPRGAATFLSKATTFLAVVFMVTSMTLAVFASSYRAQSLAEQGATQTQQEQPKGQEQPPAEQKPAEKPEQPAPSGQQAPAQQQGAPPAQSTPAKTPPPSHP